jgi:hypothetical protein
MYGFDVVQIHVEVPHLIGRRGYLFAQRPLGVDDPPAHSRLTYRRIVASTSLPAMKSYVFCSDFTTSM